MRWYYKRKMKYDRGGNPKAGDKVVSQGLTKRAAVFVAISKWCFARKLPKKEEKKSGIELSGPQDGPQGESLSYSSPFFVTLVSVVLDYTYSLPIFFSKLMPPRAWG